MSLWRSRVDGNTTIALCAIGIAVGSLVMSIREFRLSRDHNRRSVQPLLRINRRRNLEGTEGGLILVNHGLGPAVITGSSVTFDGQLLGPWTLETFDQIKGDLPLTPKVVTVRPDNVIPAGTNIYLLRLDNFNVVEHAWFWTLITDRLRFEIKYSSIYGDDSFTVKR